MTITEFLLARIAEDEKKIDAMIREADRVRTAPIFSTRSIDWLSGVDIFVSPRRWRAECAAKRAIVEWADEFQHSNDGDFVLRELATVYADHEDYDTAWRP